MRFRFVEEHRGKVPTERLCQIMDVSPRGFRAYRSRPMSQSQRKDMVLLAHIREQHKLSLGSYGRPRMTEELKELGFDVGHRRIGRIMRQNSILVVRTHKHKVTTIARQAIAKQSAARGTAITSLISRRTCSTVTSQRINPMKNGLSVIACNHLPVIVVDISYIWTREGWLYLSVVLDLYSRRVIGWAVSNRMKRDLAIRALKMAVALRKPPKGCIHHSDRGSQYCSHDYQKLLRKYGFKASMSGRGNCYPSHGLQRANHCRAMDNAAMEAFFKTIKAELIWWHSWETRRDVEIAIFEYINGFYNPRRRHSTLGWKSPFSWFVSQTTVRQRLAFERIAA